MENQKRYFIPSPPKTPATPVTPGTPGTPQLASTPGTPITPVTPEAQVSLDTPGTSPMGSMPGKMPSMNFGPGAGQLPKMPSMPNIGLGDFKMAGFMEEQLNHHKTHHLDADGNCKPHLKKEGFKFMKKFMG